MSSKTNLIQKKWKMYLKKKIRRNTIHLQNDSSSEEKQNHAAESKTFLLKNVPITWSSAEYYQHSGHAKQNAIKMNPGPIRNAIYHAHDIFSAFYLFITPVIEKNIWRWQIWRVLA